MLLRREVVVGELQPERDMRSEKYAAIEFFGAVPASHAVRIPALRRRPLDLLALSRSAPNEQQGQCSRDAQAANSTDC